MPIVLEKNEPIVSSTPPPPPAPPLGGTQLGNPGEQTNNQNCINEGLKLQQQQKQILGCGLKYDLVNFI